MHEQMVRPSLHPVPPTEAPQPVAPSYAQQPVPPVEPYAKRKWSRDRKGVMVILAFFSPAGFTKPIRHLKETLRQLSEAWIPHLVVEAGEKQIIPESLWFKTEQAIFLKENLWNLGARHCDAEHLVFLDGDVEFGNPHWLHLTRVALSTQFDLVQPYDQAVWLRDDRTTYCQRGAVAEAIRTKTPLDLRIQHPGFGWAMTRKAFEDIGGWYEFQPLGAGDTAFAVALDTSLQHAAVEKLFSPPSYLRYQQRASGLGLRIGCVPHSTVYHRYHGEFAKRQYDRRYSFLPDLLPSGELPMDHDPQGLLRWTDPRGHELCKAYFQSRDEDS